MIKYIVSTVDRYNNGARVGQIVCDSPWSADIVEEAYSFEEALKKETRWVADCIEQTGQVEDLDERRGLIWWIGEDKDEYLTEVNIDTVEEATGKEEQ